MTITVQTDDHAAEIRAATRAFLGDRWSVESLRDWAATGSTRTDLWSEAASMGWFRLLASEGAGGLGLDSVSAASLMHLVGSALVPGPVLDSMVVGSLTADRGLEIPEDARICYLDDELTRSADGLLSGGARAVPGAPSADWVVGRVASRGEVSLVAMPTSAPGVSVTPVGSIDALLEPGDVSVSGAGMAWSAEGASVTVARIDLLRALLRASEIAGVVGALTRMSAEYALQRKQFGRPIGSFQAIKARLAEMQVLATVTENLVHDAASAVDRGELDRSPERWVSVAKAYASRAARRAAEEALQIHGGIGFTQDHVLHLYFKHALTLQAASGDEFAHAERLLAIQLERLTSPTGIEVSP